MIESMILNEAVGEAAAEAGGAAGGLGGLGGGLGGEDAPEGSGSRHAGRSPVRHLLLVETPATPAAGGGARSHLVVAHYYSWRRRYTSSITSNPTS